MLAEKLSALRLPPLMVSGDGTPVDSAERWRMRRRELIELLSREEYGYTRQRRAAYTLSRSRSPTAR